MMNVSVDAEPIVAGRVISPGLRTISVGELTFETGGWLPEVQQAYETWGTLNQDGSNAILILHALTGDSHVVSSEALPHPGWWESLVGPGRPIDTRKWFVVAPNMVGGCYGSTGPSSPDPDGRPWGSRFPFTTIRDSVHAEARLADALGIETWHAVLGGSMGGARALEWAATYPERVRGAGILACGGAASAEQIAFAQSQVAAIKLDPHYRGGDYYGQQPPEEGLGIARRIAHITYRSEAELQYRFARKPQGQEDPFGQITQRTGRYQIESYLDYKAKDLASRFDANSYVVLTEALMSHDVGRNRGGQQAAVARIVATPFIAAVSSDRLYFPSQSQQLADDFNRGRGAQDPDHPQHVLSHQIDSPIGHDGFLTAPEQIADELIRVLEL
ncbi:homoserine O-acetyltransferase [Auritidibacter sp. NML130574]|nr:homoserine O-acetyltransferase [Auritidibacter sp. NML130574]